MRSRSRTKRVATCTVTVLLITLAVGLTSQAAGNPTSPPPAPSDDIAVVTLAKQLHIPLRVAAERIGWQRAAVPAIPKIAQYLGARYGGAWFDTDGRFHVGVVTTRSGSGLQVMGAASIPPIAAAHVSSVTDITAVRWPDAELARVTAALSPAIARINRGATVKVTLRTVAPENAVEIVTGTGVLTAAQNRFIAVAESRFGTRVLRKTISGDNDAVLDTCASPQRCDPPLRAGLEIDSSGGSCTAGPIVRSNSDQKLYVMTSGHCIFTSAVDDIWYATFYDGVAHAIGQRHNYYYGGSDDEGIITINKPGVDGWNPRAEILVMAGADTTYDPTYAVSGTGFSEFGIRVCKAGAFYGTTCGQVIGLNATGPTGITGLGQADYYGGRGDSGAPIFSGHIVYGIHESHIPTNVDASSTCYYVSIAFATESLRVHVAIGT
jgi:hypothetical protein